MIEGFWPLVGSDPVLYTAKAADIIQDTQTGKEYVRGKMVLWHGEKIDPPTPIEKADPERWKFIYLHSNRREMQTKDYVREIWANGLFRK